MQGARHGCLENDPQEDYPLGELPPKKMPKKNYFTWFLLLLTLSYSCYYLDSNLQPLSS